jgi:hypothetical protein
VSVLVRFASRKFSTPTIDARDPRTEGRAGPGQDILCTSTERRARSGATQPTTRRYSVQTRSWTSSTVPVPSTIFTRSAGRCRGSSR